MIVFNLRKEKYAHQLIASGVANRWNKKDEFVIYTGENRALSTLELVVHRSSIYIDATYKMMVIEINASNNDVLEFKKEDLPCNWKSFKAYSELQSIASEWYKSQQYLILKVPSVLVNNEFNYILNTKHPQFKTKVKIKELEFFSWDDRLNNS
ncbi:MAG: RES family NAD+ phosphorylase [Crocinitomicaceae bacterium]|nr:RES family NAD+ phosphorylase [Crocinitomicaceae bacterium]